MDRLGFQSLPSQGYGSFKPQRTPAKGFHGRATAGGDQVRLIEGRWEAVIFLVPLARFTLEKRY